MSAKLRRFRTWPVLARPLFLPASPACLPRLPALPACPACLLGSAAACTPDCQWLNPHPAPLPCPAQASTNARFFCRDCGSHLWAQDPSWPAWFYPFASAIDTELPAPPKTVHMMLGSRAPWVAPQVGGDWV